MESPSEPPQLGRCIIVRQLTLALEWIGALVLFSMMVLTFVDVLGRYLFSSPVPGGFEVTEIMLASLIYCGLPLITMRDGHISVDLVEGLLPGWFKALRDRVIALLMTAVLGYIGYRLFGKAGDFVNYNDQTAVLNIPLAPLCYAMAVLTILSAIIAAVLAVLGRPAPTRASLTGADT